MQGPTVSGKQFGFKAHPDNTNTVWIGNDGEDDVSSTTGFPLDPGEAMFIDLFALFGTPVDDGVAETLALMYFDADTNGEKVCWIRYA